MGLHGRHAARPCNGGRWRRRGALSWLRRRETQARIEAEAETLIGEMGIDAYAEARRREREANDFATARHWARTASAIARKISDKIGLDAAMAKGRDADFSTLIETFKAQAQAPGSPLSADCALAPEEAAAPERQPPNDARSLQDRARDAFRARGER